MKTLFWRSAHVLLLSLAVASCSGSDNTSNTNQEQEPGFNDGGSTSQEDGQASQPENDLDFVPPARPAGCTEPSRLTAQCTSGFCNVPPGCFMMGSPPWDTCRDDDEVPHWVMLTRRFSMSETEVTRAQFRTVMGYEPQGQAPCEDDCPVENISWHQAAAYANALSASKGLAQCYSCTGEQEQVSCTVAAAFEGGQSIYGCPGYRLPTEAEWEYAYRAGSTTTYYNGAEESCYNDDPTADAIGWTSLNSDGAPHPVGLKAPNSWGLRDMGGNIEEWVHDGYLPYPTEGVTDPVQELQDAESYNARGGSWQVYPKDIRAADRNEYTAFENGGSLGLRVVRSMGGTVP